MIDYSDVPLEKQIQDTKEEIIAHGENFELLSRMGDLYYRLPNLQLALECFFKSTEFNKDVPDIYGKIAMIYTEMLDFEKGITYLNKAITLDPSQPEFYTLAGEIYEEQGEIEEAITFFKKALELSPDNKKIIISLGDIYLRNNRTDDDAIQIYDKMIKLGRVDARIEKNMLDYILQMDKVKEEHLPILESVYKKDKNIVVRSKLLEAYFRLNKTDDRAKDIYNEILQEDPNNLQALEIIADIQAKGNLMRKEDITLYKRAFENRIAREAVIRTLGKYFIKKYQIDPFSISVLEKYYQYEPESEQLINILTEAFIMRDELNEFERKILKKAYVLNPESKKIFLKLLHLGEPITAVGDSSLEMYERLYEDDPEDTDVITILGNAYLNSRRVDIEAINIYDKLLKLEPENKRLIEVLANKYVEMNLISPISLEVFEKSFLMGNRDERLFEILFNKFFSDDRFDNLAIQLYKEYFEKFRSPDSRKKVLNFLLPKFESGVYVPEDLVFKKELLKNWLFINPENSTVQRELFDIYSSEQALDETALNLYKIIYKSNPKDIDNLLMLTRSFINRGTINDEVTKIYMEAYPHMQDDPMLILLLAEYFRGSEQKDDFSIKMIKKAAELEKEGYQAKGNIEDLCKIYLSKQRKDEEAVKIYKDYLAIDPKNIPVVLMLSEIFIEEDDTSDESMHVLELGYGFKRDYANLIKLLAKCFSIRERNDEFAFEVYIKATDYGYRDSRIIRLILTKFIPEERSDASALKIYEVAEELGIIDSSLYYLMAKLYFNDGNFEKLMNILDIVQQQPIESPEIVLFIAKSYMEIAEFDTVTQVILKFEQKTPELLVMLAYSYYHKGDYVNLGNILAELFGLNYSPTYVTEMFSDYLYYIIQDMKKAKVPLSKLIIDDDVHDKEVLIKLARINFVLEDFQESLNIYQRLLKNDPEFIEAYLKISEIYLKKEQHYEALDYLKKLIIKGYHSPIVYINIGDIYTQLEQVNRAIDAYEKAIEIEPNNVKFHYKLGYLYVQEDLKEFAIEHFNKALLLEDDDSDILQTLAVIYFEEENTSEAAKEVYEKLYDQNPGNIDMKLMLARIYAIKGRNDPDAIDMYEDLIKNDKSSYEINQRLSEFYISQNISSPLAIKLIRKTFGERTDNKTILDYLGNYYISREEVNEEVEDVYKELFKEGKWKEKSGYLLAKVYTRQGKYEEAIPYLEEVIFINPYNENTYILLGDIYFHIKKFDLAKKRLNKAIQLNPKNSEGYYILGLVEAEQQNKMFAIDLLKKALEITNRGIYIAALAQIHHDLGKIDDATNLMKKAIKIAPEIVENHFLLGLWYFETEENDRAREYFNYCIKADPSNVKYHIYLNRNLSKLMMFQEAINNLAKLDMQKEVLIELGKIYLLADRHDEAKNVYSEAVSHDPNCIEARDALGVMYFDIDKSFQSATSEFEQILMIDEGHQNANLYLGRLEYSKQPRNYKLAIKHWEKVERIEDSKTKFAFGHSYFQMRNFSKALSTLLKLSAIEFNPDALLLLGKIYEELGDYKNAFNIYKKIIDKENKYQNAWYCLADLTDKLNQIDDSKDYYTHIITNIKKDPEIYKRLGELFIYHFANNKFSIEGFEKYIELKYGDNITKVPKDLVRIIALVYLKEKEFQKSRNYAATLSKGKDFTEYILTINNYQMEDWELCYNHLIILSKRYAAQKWFIPYQITLAEVQEYRGKYVDALKIYEQVLLLDPKQSEEIYFRFAHIIYNLVREVKRKEWVHSNDEKKPKKIDNFIMDSIEEVIKIVQKSKLLKRKAKQFSPEAVYLKILANYALTIKEFSYAKKKYKTLSKMDKLEIFGKIQIIRTEFLSKLDSLKGSKSRKKYDYTKYEKELLKVLKPSPNNYDGFLLKYELKKQKNKQKAIKVLQNAFFKLTDPDEKMDILMRTVDELLKVGENETAIQILKDVLSSAPKFTPAIIRLSKIYFNIKEFKEASKFITKLPFILHLENEFFVMKLITNFKLKNYTQVLEQFVFTDFSMDNWLEENPENFIYVAYSLFKLGSNNKAFEIVEKFKADNRNEDYYLYYPEMLQFKRTSEDNLAAKQILLEGIKEFSESVKIKNMYIDNLILLEKYPDAETFFNTFNDELKDDPEVSFSIATLEERLKDYSSTETKLINIQGKLEDPLKAEELLANVHMKTGDISNAIRLFESVRKKYVDRFDTVKETLIPHLYLFSKDPLSIERIKLFEKIKDLDYKLVELYQNHREYEKFEDTVKSLIDRFPNDTELYYKIIKIRIEKLDEPQGTLNYINSILDFSPDAAEAKYYKAFIYSNILNETENALDLMKEVISIKEEVKYLILLGEIYLKMERTTDAVDMFSIVIEREPDNFKIYKLLSKIEFTAENFDKSLELINKAIDMGLNKDEVLEQMASIYVNTNRYEEAIAVFEELLDKGIGEGNIHAQLGAAYLMLGNNVKAQQNLMHSIELDQSAGECFFKMGEIFLKQKKYVQSIKTLEKAREKKFDDQNLHFYLGVAYHSIKKEDLAQREFEIALQDQRDDYFVHKYLGEIYFYQEKYEKAAIEYSRAREINPKKIEIYSFLARSYLETKEYQKVIELVDYVLKFEKQNIQLYIMKCAALFQLEKYDDAEKILMQVLKVDSNNQDALNLIGKIFYSRELYNESLRYFEKCLELNLNNFDALKYSGMINLNKFRLHLAEEQLYKAQYLFNADPDIPLLLGNIFMKESKWIDAIIQFRKAIKLNTTNYEAFVGLGDIYQFKQRWPEAIQEYEKVLTFNYYLPNIHYNLGRLYEKITMPDKAEQYYRQTIRMDPENYSAMEKLGLLLISQHRYNEALTFVINALTKEHDNVKIMIQLIECYRNLDQLEQAKKILNQANQLAPDNFDLIKAWGDYHLDLENLKEAKKSYEALIQKDPDYVPALLKLGHIYTGLKDYEKAEELYKKIIRMTSTRKDIAFYGLGFLYEDQGNNENAIQWYLRAISENNNYLAPLLRLGNIYYNEGNYIRSIDYWENAIKQGVEETEVFYYLGNAYLKIEENIKALNIFEEGRKRNQDLRFNYGIIETYFSLKQYELALELLKSLKMKDKDESESLHLFMSKVYIHLNQPEKALIENYILFKKGVNQIESMFQVAKIYINYLNRPQAGNYILEKLVKGEPENLNFNTWLFESYRKLGNFEEAEDLLRKVDAFEEKSPELYVAIGKFHEDRGDKKLARDAYINALNINPHLEEIQDKLGNL